MSFVNTVDSIGDEALTNSIIDRSITEITDNFVTSIGTYAFGGCSQLTTANFPAVTSIGDYAFNGCSNLTTVDFPAVTSINYQTFESCRKLTALILRSETMCTLSSTNAFNNCYHILGTTNSTYNPDGLADGYIYVPRALVDSYKTATNWSTYANQIRAIEDYPLICNKYTWESVQLSMDAGTYATDYAIGDCVPLDLGSEGVINMQIAAFDADDLADGSGKAKISWISKELLATSHRMNPALMTNDDNTYQEGTGNVGGWGKCEMRTYLKDTIKPLIPETVASRIATVTKTHWGYDTAGAGFTLATEDDVWIPAFNEMMNTAAIYYSLFSDSSNKIKYRAGTDSTANWWFRDAGNEGASKFRYCSTTGSFGSRVPDNLYGVCLGFCTN